MPSRTTAVLVCLPLSMVCALSLWGARAAAQEVPEESQGEVDSEGEEPTGEDELSEEELEALIAESEVIEIVATPPAGSGHAVDEKELERFEHDDVHKVLSGVPGVYIREEDGYGLRPNIGMRGSGSERSAKITIMEDGVLSAPAPYAAPAAYYFPLVTRMTRLEVLKGPAAIRHGPHTVGGALNLISRPIPGGPEATVDVAGGSNLYGKAHGSAGQSWTHGGLLVEAAKIRTDGFKELDDGGDTGFDKNDVLLKGRVNSSSSGGIYHELSAKAGYSDEVSNETYTGLADSDFRATPYRRYAGTQLDRMDWRHLQMQLSHRAEFLSHLVGVTTTVYRNQFSRDWRKLNNFDTDRTLRDILHNPEAGNNAVFYGILQGEGDSTGPDEALLIGTNERDFVSQGVQMVGNGEREGWGATHDLEAGLRLHLDSVDRFQYEDSFLMMGGDLVALDAPRDVATDARGRAVALAAYAQDSATFGRLALTFGTRAEIINTRFRDRMSPDQNTDGTQSVLIPGAGASYRVLPGVSLVAGVHRGFSPAAPSADEGIRPETSINYEGGARASHRGIEAEAIGFFSDYSNLKGTCTLSSGCQQQQLGDEFNGGRVHAMGVEASASAEPYAGPLRFPLRFTYTFNRAEFQDAFTSGNPQWGDVQAGDRMPYLPSHQLSVQTGIGGAAWEFAVAGRYASAMRDVAGQGRPDRIERTDATRVVDLSGYYQFSPFSKVYATVNNLFDQAYIVSRRPYGARPGVPRLIIVGHKSEF